MSIDLKGQAKVQKREDILLAKSKLVVSRHSRIKASVYVAVFSFDLATESCPFKKTTSFSSVLTRSHISPKRRTFDKVREVRLQDFKAAAVAAPSTDSWTEGMKIKKIVFSRENATAIGRYRNIFIKQKSKVAHLRISSRHQFLHQTSEAKGNRWLLLRG